MEAIKKDGRALKYVPNFILNKEMCLIAVHQYGFTLMYVPLKLRDTELCSAAEHRDYYAALKSVPEPLRDIVQKNESTSI